MAHLTEQDRARIVSLRAERRSLRQIALELGKSHSTIKREILKHRERSKKMGRFVHYNPCAECRKCDVHGALEKDADGVKTTNIFYFLALASWQKARMRAQPRGDQTHTLEGPPSTDSRRTTSTSSCPTSTPTPGSPSTT